MYLLISAGHPVTLPTGAASINRYNLTCTVSEHVDSIKLLMPIFNYEYPDDESEEENDEDILDKMHSVCCVWISFITETNVEAGDA